jgi:hypothetical protein
LPVAVATVLARTLGELWIEDDVDGTDECATDTGADATAG